MIARIKKLFRASSRGQMRAVDFMVSAFIFLIMLAQFVLLLFNIQVGLHTTVLGDLNQSDATDLYRQIFLQPGSPNWGTQPELPQSFGLSLETTQQVSFPSRSVLDPAKLARIGSDPQAVQSYADFQPVTYQFIHDQLGLDDGTHFQLKLLPPLNITYQQVSTSNDRTTYTYEIEVTHATTRKPVVDTTISLIVVDFLTGSATFFSGITNNDGRTTVEITAPSNLGRDAEQGFGIIITARKGSALWGITWVQDENLTPALKSVVIDGNSTNFASFLTLSLENKIYALSSSFTALSQLTNQTVLLLEEQQENIFKVVANQSSTTTDPIILEAPATRTSGMSLLIHYVRVDSGTIKTYYYRVMSLPAIIDKENGPNRFHPPLSPSIIPDNIKGKITIQRPVIVRGLMMIAELTYFEFY